MPVVVTNIDADYITNNNAETEALELAAEVGEVCQLKLSVMGITEDGVDAASWEKRASFFRKADGEIVFMGGVEDVFSPCKSSGAALWDVKLVPDGSGNVEVHVVGADGKNVGWVFFGTLDKTDGQDSE